MTPPEATFTVDPPALPAALATLLAVDVWPLSVQRWEGAYLVAVEPADESKAAKALAPFAPVKAGPAWGEWALVAGAILVLLVAVAALAVGAVG